jgi:hypothetical protein
MISYLDTSTPEGETRMGLFARKTEAAPAARAKRARRGATCTELGDAIAAVCAEMADCSARNTLEMLYVLTGDAADGDTVTLDGPAPVTLAAFDEALAEARECDLPAGTLGPLERFRALLVQAEAQDVKAAGVPVTRAEFDALANAHALALVVIADMLHDSQAGPIAHRLEAAAQSVEFKSAEAGIRALLGRLEKARSADGARKCRRASGRLNVVNGGGGYNF